MTAALSVLYSALRRRPRVFPGWYVVGGAMFIDFYVSAAFVYGFQAFFNPITLHFGWSRSVTAGAYSLQRLEGGIASPITGLLVDRLGARKMTVGGLVLVGAGLLGLSQIQEAWQYYLSFAVIALGTSTLFPSFPAATVNWFRRLRGRALGILACGAIPSGLAAPLLVLLIDQVGWRHALLFLGLSVLALLPAATFIRHRPEPYGLLPDGDPPGLGTATGSAQQAKPVLRNDVPSRNPASRAGVAPPADMTLRQAITSPAFWLLALIFGIHQMGPGALFVVQVPYFQSIGFSAQAAASTLGVFTLLSGIGRVGGGVLVDLLDKRWVMAGLLAANCAGLLILMNITSYWMVFPFAFLLGVGFGGMMPARGTLISEYFGVRNFASVGGLIRFVDVGFGIATPFLVGLSFDMTESYKPAFLLIALLIGLSIPLPYFLQKPRALEVAT